MFLLFSLNTSLQLVVLLVLVKMARNLIEMKVLKWGETLRWKKHTLLFHCSGGHGSSSGGPNKDTNFVPSSAVNIKKKNKTFGGGQWLCDAVSSFVPAILVLTGTTSSDHFFVWCGRMSVAFPTPSRKKGGFGTCRLHNAHKLPAMHFISLKTKQPFPAFFSKKTEINKNPRQNPLYYKLPSTCSFPIS